MLLRLIRALSIRPMPRLYVESQTRSRAKHRNHPSGFSCQRAPQFSERHNREQACNPTDRGRDVSGARRPQVRSSELRRRWQEHLGVAGEHRCIHPYRHRRADVAPCEHESRARRFASSAHCHGTDNDARIVDVSVRQAASDQRGQAGRHSAACESSRRTCSLAAATICRRRLAVARGGSRWRPPLYIRATAF
jgi:hypothetical protein